MPVGLCEFVLHVVFEVLDAAVDDCHIAQDDCPDQELLSGKPLARKRVAQHRVRPGRSGRNRLGLSGRLDAAQGARCRGGNRIVVDFGFTIA